VATSACWRETELARRGDVSKGLATVLLRGTKRKTRFRTVPIVSPAQQSLLAYAVEHAKGEEEALFQPWGNVRRDLADACEEAKIDRCSPNDLRRTFASWQVEAGVPLFPIAQAMGHKDTRMLDGLRATADATEPAAPKNSEAQRTLQSTGPLMFERAEVPGAGIEPATRGFSVPCSTD
jgi:integrase